MDSHKRSRLVWMGILALSLAVLASWLWNDWSLRARASGEVPFTAVLEMGLVHMAVWVLGMLAIHGMGRRHERHLGAEEAIRADLQAAEERYRLALEGAGDGVWDLDLATGQVFHSPRMSEMLGYAPSHLPADPAAWKALTHPDDHARAMAALEAHRRRETPRFEAVMRIRDHQHGWRWILARGQASRNEAGEAVRVLGTHADITPFKEQEARLKTEIERAQVTLSSIGDAVVTTDMEGNVGFMNPVAERLTGWGAVEATGMPVEAVIVLMDEATRSALPHPVTQCRATGETAGVSADAYLLQRDGGEIAIQDSAAPILDGDGRLVGVVMVFRDVTESRGLARQMSWQLKHDALTGLVSRREFEHRLDDLVQDARATGARHTVFYMDLDNFKIVNDTCGHIAGDELLKQLSFILAEQMRKNDTLARLGGDEFGALLGHCPLDIARSIADKLLRTVGDFRFVWGGHAFDVGISIGIVEIDLDTPSATEVMSAADIACYRAKEEGRNRAHVYTGKIADIHEKQREVLLASDLREAIDAGRFVLFAQEIRSLRDKPGRYYEVLVRMLDKHGELMSPGAFIIPAERFGLMTLLDQWVIRQTLAAMAAAGPGAAEVRLAVNLSGLSLQNPDLPRFIRQALEEYGVEPARLTFEITETAAIAQLSSGVRFMRELEATGCRFALDDFGSGMSSFAYLKALPVNVLKIDGAFVRDLLSDRADRAFVEAIQNVARTLGMETVAEYAETPELITALGEIGVDYAQGYGVAKPRALEMILRGV